MYPRAARPSVAMFVLAPARPMRPALATLAATCSALLACDRLRKSIAASPYQRSATAGIRLRRRKDALPKRPPAQPFAQLILVRSRTWRGWWWQAVFTPETKCLADE